MIRTVAVRAEMAFGLCLLLVGGCSNPEPSPSAGIDTGAIKAADSAYAAAWLANDSEAVMGTLTEDAVIIPSGMEAIEGATSIREFWWPADSPPTTVKEFTLDQREVGGGDGLAFVRGSFSLAFDYDGKAYASDGEYESRLRRLPDGSWRIARRMWSDHPPAANEAER